DSSTHVNIHSIAIQVPRKQLTRDGSRPVTVGDARSVIGVWCTASRQKGMMRGGMHGMPSYAGPWVQVSRLGNPLINEVLIPLGKKDFWNSQDPEDDSQFATNYTNSELAGLMNLLYGAPPGGHAGGALAPVATTGRNDLSLLFLTGVPGLNFTGPAKSDLLRLNTAIKPGAK